MVSTEERMRILMMIQEGKISAAEGARLIEALDDLSQPTPPSPQPLRGYEGGKKPRYLRVLITDTDSGKARVNVRLPVSLINSGMRMGARFAPEIEGLDMEDLNAWMNSGEVGQIVDIFDEEDGEHIEVFLE
jgi:hypothetical protein